MVISMARARTAIKLVPPGAARDPAVVGQLRAALAAARSGELQSAAVVGFTRQGTVRYWEAQGSQRDALFKLIGALAIMQADLMKQLKDVA